MTLLLLDMNNIKNKSKYHKDIVVVVIIVVVVVIVVIRNNLFYN